MGENMKALFKYLTFAIQLNNCLSQDDLPRVCNVTEQKTQTELPCTFPFSLNGQIFNECTNTFDPEGKYWCSTRTTPDGAHVASGGYWGYCSEDCILETKTGTLLDQIEISERIVSTSL